MQSNSISGNLNRILYRSKDFIVGIVGETKVCGKLPDARPGLKVTLYGKMEDHSKYGQQFSFGSYKIQENDDYYYLSSGLVRQVGESLAQSLVKTFTDPIKTALKDPQKLASVKGITEQKASEISRSIRETIKYKQVAIDLAPCGFTPQTLVKVYHQLNDYKEVLRNPYILTEVDLIGFIKADIVAQRLGIDPQSDQRVRAASAYELHQSSKEGHIYLTERDLAIRTYNLLNKKISPDQIEKNIKALEYPREEDRIYLPHLLKAENGVAELLPSLKTQEKIDTQDLIRTYEIPLSKEQQRAVALALSTSALIITGGPGTGKTETVKAITAIHKQILPDHKIVLIAPTGRASRRMAEVTGLKAQTIHSLIVARKKIDAKLVIVDEMSMTDLETFYKLLSLITDSRLILVGDADQLPSVGPGQVLKDLVDLLPTVRLQKVFRQAAESEIIVNAHKINSGNIDLQKGKDFFFINKETPEEILDTILRYVRKYLRSKGDLHGLQILSMMKKGTLGTDNLNSLIQDMAVPGRGYFRAGDKVIQTVNNYDKLVFNGDIGTITRLNPFVVSYETHEVEYKPFETDQLSLAYAVTAHKAQGSEFPVVVMPLHTQQYIMLNRQILYTAATRATRQIVVVGNYRSLALAVGNTSSVQRNSCLRKKLKNRLKY
jgi:exodeoxyribonuclease V alpha subunit